MGDDKGKPTCGIVMPISAIEDYPANHWQEVKTILIEAIEDAGFDGQLVSDADNVGIIQKRIIQNLYENPIVVCDVSGKNPNVMFELGLRLAFDKPTIIVKDERMGYSFDTGQIEHLVYPTDLRYQKIIEFQEKLAEKIKGTHDRATNDPQYTTFLKHFGEFKVAKIEKREVPGEEFIIDELKTLRDAVQRVAGLHTEREVKARTNIRDLDFKVAGAADGQIETAVRRVSEMTGVERVAMRKHKDHFHVIVSPSSDTSRRLLRKAIQSSVPLLEPPSAPTTTVAN